MRNVRMSGYWFVSGGTKSAGRLPVTLPPQPGAPMHAGCSGVRSISSSLPAAPMPTFGATLNAADFGRQSTDAAGPVLPGSMMTSTTSSLTKIGRTSNSPRKSKGSKSRSSITTSPVTLRTPAAATCEASAS
jgi:hypothetical protein